MTNHVHLVLEAGREDSLATFFRRLHGRYAQYLNARRSRTGHLWQNRYYSCALGPTHLWPVISYVEANPVCARIVTENETYLWSSAKAHVTGPSGETGRLPDWNFWQDAGGAAGWQDELGTVQDVRQILTIRACTHSGKPFGEDSFVS